MAYEYRIVDEKWGAWWPEIYSDGQAVSGDLEFLRMRNPNSTFFVQRREVGDWTEWDESSEMAS